LLVPIGLFERGAFNHLVLEEHFMLHMIYIAAKLL
jgi:hypothetical protein